MDEYALEVDHVSMKFNLSTERIDSLKDYILKSIKREVSYDEFWALSDVSFRVKKGERLGILGINGAGKSTLLKVVAGVFKPTEGTVITRGRIAPLLELGAGFDRQYTGRENIYLYGAVLGYSRAFIDSKYDEIVDFSGLGQFIDVPVKNYSSGMRSRLGFSIATAVNPDILILDEVLSVGDSSFRRKSERKIMEMFDQGVTVLFVSHSLSQVQRLCDKALLLEQGHVSAYGSIDEVSAIYENIIGEELELKREAARKKRAARRRRIRRRRRRLAREAAEAAAAAAEAAETAAEAAETAPQEAGEGTENPSAEVPPAGSSAQSAPSETPASETVSPETIASETVSSETLASGSVSSGNIASETVSPESVSSGEDTGTEPKAEREEEPGAGPEPAILPAEAEYRTVPADSAEEEHRAEA